MPFFGKYNKNKQKYSAHLQVQRSHIYLLKKRKRVCSFTSPGSISIEAAMALTVFIGMVLFMVSFLIMVSTQFSVQMKLNNIALITAKSKFYVQLADKVTDYNDTLKKIKTEIEENKNKINLVLLDVMMPKLDGWSVLRQIRQESKVPIIMLTARGEEQDELFGFELGVDEYISKPFSPKILVARVEAILKRTAPDSKEVKDYGGVEIDKEGRTVKVDGKLIELSLREYELLTYLVENKDIALSRDKILNNVWNYDYYGDSRTIDSHIKKIRHKLGKKGKYIKTIRGVGYKFEVK